LVLAPRRPRPTLFPYTTLFRSKYLLTHARVPEQGDMLGGGLRRRVMAKRDEVPRNLVGHIGETLIRIAHCAGSASGAILRALRRSEEHTSELQSRENLVCRLLL